MELCQPARFAAQSEPASARRATIEDIVQLGNLVRDVCAPHTEAAFGVHRTHPGLDGSALGAVLLRILALDFEHQRLAAREADGKIGERFTCR